MEELKRQIWPALLSPHIEPSAPTASCPSKPGIAPHPWVEALNCQICPAAFSPQTFPPKPTAI